MSRVTIDVIGRVQGVGFRPYVYTLARTLGLRGFVQNRGARVLVDVEGDRAAVEAFVGRLTAAAPQGASIADLSCRPAAPAHYRQFEIARSEAATETHVFVPPDLATCDACVRELFDPVNRRYRHAFIACTACGPRYSILKALPFDRANTSMASFALCDACRAEYRDPGNRRFHAQTLACPECGPALEARVGDTREANSDEALRLATRVLLGGGIIAVKGLGGFHLACDATDQDAVATIRERKGRDAKPLAVMYADEEGRRRGARIGQDVLAALTSGERPITLVPRDAWATADPRLAPGIAAGCPSVGLFLPYTPLHHLLLNDVNRPLVMTSANHSDEPMVIDDDAAIATLGGVADLILMHDRRIERRADDSIVRVARRRSWPVRRARGYAPVPLPLAEHGPVDVLAVGGHLKNTFCLVSGALAYLSPHVGTLDSAPAYASLEQAIPQFASLLQRAPGVIAHDLHPDYLSTRLAHTLPASRRIAVQHHHAHVLACVAEHGCTEPVIGAVFDGAGLGTDGAIWGGEFLLVDGVRCERIAHLAYVPLAGGDAAAREPWRMAVAHLNAAYGESLGPLAGMLTTRLSPDRLRFLRQMIARGVSSVPTSSMGRLFDAVAALLGICDAATYEGQAAMELEAHALLSPAPRYSFDLDTSSLPWRVEAAPVIRSIAKDVATGSSVAEIASAFHDSVAAMTADVAARIARYTGARRVVLSGGVFQNARLGQSTAHALSGATLDVLEHRLVPCNDGGLSLGQALQAVRMTRSPAETRECVACA